MPTEGKPPSIYKGKTPQLAHGRFINENWFQTVKEAWKHLATDFLVTVQAKMNKTQLSFRNHYDLQLQDLIHTIQLVG